MDELDHYQLLGVHRLATPDEIRSAYFDAARRLHPDSNDNPADNELFLKIQQAYQVLSDARQREAYDKLLAQLRASGPVLIEPIYSRLVIPVLDELQLIYILLQISDHRTQVEIKPPPPINLCIIIDRSTSMQGERMDMVKATAIELIRQLRAEDVLSIVSFSDRAEVIQPAARRIERTAVETQIQMLSTAGGTEIFRGLESGFFELRRMYAKNLINHMILITDGQTYGDEEVCLNLASQAAAQGIRITAFGIGTDWNDAFMDKLTGSTGGVSLYVSHPSEIRDYLQRHFNQLQNMFAEQVMLDVKLKNDIEFSYGFRLCPDPAPLPASLPLILGSIPKQGTLSVLLELLLPPLPQPVRQFSLLHGSINLEIPSESQSAQRLPLHLSLPVNYANTGELAPEQLIEALAQINLYRLQERARMDITNGRSDEASVRLQHMATHLLAQGKRDLARTALLEADNIQNLNSFSQEGNKRIKYRTRALLLPSGGPP